MCYTNTTTSLQLSNSLCNNSVVMEVSVSFKVAPSFPINKIHTKNSLRNLHTYIMINASNEGISVEF